MKLHKTKQLELASLLPTALDFKKILLARNPSPSPNDKKEVHRLEAGEIGEQKVLDIFQKYSPDHWIGIQNIWLKFYGTSEFDFILLTNNIQYLFEIKNYNGTYVYKDGVNTINQHVISSNPINQARSAVTKMQSILNEHSKNIQVKGAVIFAGDNCEVSIQSEVNDIAILKTEDLYDFIQKIILEEQSNSYKSVDTQSVIEHFERHEVSPPYPIQPINQEQMKQIRLGIYCAYCGNFDLTIEKHYVKCSCGFHESREEAILRTICEYGTLNFKDHLSTGVLTDFLNGQASHVHIQKILAKHFEMVKNNRYTYYINKIFIYSKIYSQFIIDLPSYFYSKRGRPVIQIFE